MIEEKHPNYVKSSLIINYRIINFNIIKAFSLVLQETHTLYGAPFDFGK